MRILLLCFISIFSSTLAMSIISISNASFNMSSVDRFLMFVPRTSVLNLSFFLFNYSLYSNYSLFFPLKKEHPSSYMTHSCSRSSHSFLFTAASAAASASAAAAVLSRSGNALYICFVLPSYNYSHSSRFCFSIFPTSKTCASASISSTLSVIVVVYMIAFPPLTLQSYKAAINKS